MENAKNRVGRILRRACLGRACAAGIPVPMGKLGGPFLTAVNGGESFAALTMEQGILGFLPARGAPFRLG